MLYKSIQLTNIYHFLGKFVLYNRFYINKFKDFVNQNITLINYESTSRYSR
jgi:hypothetical protein